MNEVNGSSNVLAMAFAGKEPPELYGKTSADLKAFEAVLRPIIERNRSVDRFVIRHSLMAKRDRGVSPAEGSAEGSE